VYANPACPAADPCDLLGLLHGPHRVGCGLVMILLSQQGLSAAQIADLLGYDSATVRRWIHRYHQHGTGGLADLHQHIRNLPTGAAVLAEDETRINLLPWVRATWILRGQRQQIMTPGKNRRRTIFGAVDLRAGRFSYQVTRKAISATFTTFCEHLLAAYPQAPVVAVVCDNVSIHRSKIVQRWLKTHPRLLVLHGARYSPHDNPIERIWGALKAWLANNPTLTSKAACGRCMPSLASASPRSCWRSPRRTVHPGYPPITCSTSDRPLSRRATRSRVRWSA
jgi:transposase